MLPTFVVIGAMKGGTGALYHYLAAHPEVCMSSIKETNFFVEALNFSRGREWYESLFARPAKQYGEASPNYTKWPRHPGVPERMHGLVPEARLIYIVRDPIARMVSQYAHNVAKRKEVVPLEDALLADERARYTAPSQYYTQLQRFLQVYPQDRVLVISSEDLRHRRRQALARVFEFLDVDAGFQSPVFDSEFHETARKFERRSDLVRLLHPKSLLARAGLARPPKVKLQPPRLELSERTRGLLQEKLQPEMDAFRRLTGERFEQWCI